MRYNKVLNPKYEINVKNLNIQKMLKSFATYTCKTRSKIEKEKIMLNIWYRKTLRKKCGPVTE
jgi:hypothetical protein